MVWLEPQDVLKVEPSANPACLGAVYEQRAGSVEPYRHTLAAAQSAEKLGTEIILRRVTGLLTQGDRCLGVTFQDGELEAGVVVLAMGPWTNEAASWCRAKIPVSPLKGQILRLRHGGGPIRTSIYYAGSYVFLNPTASPGRAPPKRWLGSMRGLHWRPGTRS